LALGFSVAELLPRARGGGALAMGLSALEESEWLQPAPDLALRARAFDDHPENVEILPAAEEAGRELAALCGVAGGLEQAARSAWEDMCLLIRPEGDDSHYLAGAAVAFPTDWRVQDKIGRPMDAIHAPIHGYAGQLARGVDHFMGTLTPGRIFGRCNWFVSPTPALRWIEENPPEIAFAHVNADNAGETLFIRSERQTLRRLPHTGAVVFTIGVYLAPLGTLPAACITRLADALTNIPAPEFTRRGAAHFAPAFQEYARRHADYSAI